MDGHQRWLLAWLNRWPVRQLGAHLQYLAGTGELALLRELLAGIFYDPESLSPDGYPVPVAAMLRAIREAEVFGSDPAEVLRCQHDALRLDVAGVGSDVPVEQRIAALRPTKRREVTHGA